MIYDWAKDKAFMQGLEAGRHLRHLLQTTSVWKEPTKHRSTTIGCRRANGRRNCPCDYCQEEKRLRRLAQM